jgi:signal transduction histidine kinase
LILSNFYRGFNILQKSLVLIGALFYLNVNLSAATADSLKYLESESDESSQKARSFLLYAQDFDSKNMQDSAEKYYNYALSLYKSVNNKLGMHAALGALGVNARNQSKYESALFYHRQSLQIALDEQNTRAQIISYNNLGVIHRRLDDLDKAIYYHNVALKLAESINDKPNIAIASNSLGNINLSLKYYAQAIKFFEKALQIEKERNNLRGLAINFNNIGSAYEYLNKNDSAYWYYNKSLDYNLKSKNDRGISICYNSLGDLERKKDNFKLALHYYSFAASIDKRYNDKYYLATTLLNIGETFLELKDANSAIKNILEALSLSLRIGSKALVQRSYENLAVTYEVKGDYKAALAAERTAKIYKDSILNEANAKELLKMNIKFENVNKEARILKLEQDQQNQKNRFFAASSIAIIAILITAFYIYRNRAKSKNAAILEEKRQIVEESNILLTEKNIELKELNAAKDRLFSIIAHDLKNPLHALIFSTDMLINYSDKFDDDKRNLLYKDMRESGRNLNALIENLLDWARAQTNNVSFEPIQMDLFQAIEKILSLMKISAANKSITLLNSAPFNFMVEADINMMFAMLRNLISNALKYTNHGGNVKITISVIEFNNSEAYKLSVIDDGVGIAPEDINTLFEIKGQRSSPGTANEKGTGLGLALCKEFIEKHNGIIEVESELGKGTKFSLIAPIKLT